MLKRFLYTISAFALAGGLTAASPAMADIVRYSQSDANVPAIAGDSADRYAYYDTERNCWLADRPFGPSADNPEPDEPEARFDSANECVAYDPNPEIVQDYDLEEPAPLPEG